MAHEDISGDSGGGAWDSFFSNAQGLIFDFAKAKIAQEARPPAPGNYPAPVRPASPTYMPPEYFEARGDDAAQMLSEIFSSPRTWVGLAAIAALVVVLVKMRR